MTWEKLHEGSNIRDGFKKMDEAWDGHGDLAELERVSEFPDSLPSRLPTML